MNITSEYGPNQSREKNALSITTVWVPVHGKKPEWDGHVAVEVTVPCR